MAGLTDKQQKFCEEYMIDLNATQAAIRAGYSEGSAKQIASENLSKPDVAERIAELRAEQTARTEITTDSILLRLNQVADRCMQSEPVMERNSSGEMEETGEFKFEHSGANRALELLGKSKGLFVERRELTGFNGDPLTLLIGEISGNTLEPGND